jgi:hypothetical protein
MSLPAASLSAQLAPVGAPKGTLRMEIRGSFESADQRIFQGRTEDYLADFGSTAFGSDRLPQLRVADSLLSAILGQSGSRINLGTQRANGQLTIGTGTISAALGVTSKLTLFADIPLVTTRVQAHFALDSTSGNAGLNGALPGLGNSVDASTAATFFNNFTIALQSLDTRINNNAYSGAQLTLARGILARGTTLQTQLAALTTDPATGSPFLPTSGSVPGQQIVAIVQALQDTLATDLAVTGFSSTPFLPTGAVTDAQFHDALANPTGPFAAFPLAESKIARMGDMDVGATYTLIDRFDQGRQLGGFRLAATGLLRLPTGQRDSPDNYLDVGTGNGRYEVGVSGTADAGAGRWGARFTGGYLLRLASLRVRRLTAPANPYPTAPLTNLRFNAGDVLSLGVRPFYRLAGNFAAHLQADYQRIASDRTTYDRPSDVVPGVDANIFSEGRRSALALGVGVSYVGRAMNECQEGHRCGWPIDASWSYTQVVSGTGDRVVKFRTTRLEIRWYQRIWR